MAPALRVHVCKTTESSIEFERELTSAVVLLGQGRMERALTRGASTEGDLAAVLEGLRETRSEVEAALVSDPEAARKLATEGAHATIEVPPPRLGLLFRMLLVCSDLSFHILIGGVALGAGKIRMAYATTALLPKL